MEKTPAAAAKVKGTIKKATLLNDTFGLLAISIYDKKPVHIFSTKDHDSVEVTYSRRWFQDGLEFVRQYKRLKLIHEYNMFMDGVYLQDQLRWYYRFDSKKVWRSRNGRGACLIER